jgi:signal peptidase I
MSTLTFLTIARRTLFAVWLSLAGLVLTLAILTHVAGALGYRIVIIRGPSMAPTIPLGALAFEQPIAADAIAVGDVVTMTLPNGTVVTHRVIHLATLDGKPAIETRGDANNAADPSLLPASAVTGIVRSHAPVLGYILAFLGIPSGILSVISMLGSLLACIWLLEEVEGDYGQPAETQLVGHGLPA